MKGPLVRVLNAFALFVTCAFTGLMAAGSASETEPEATQTRRPLPPKRTYVAARVTGEAPRIDGKLDDACWQTLGEWAGDYIQREPNEGSPASQPTLLKILYDDRNVYVAFRCFDTELDNIQHMRGKRDEFTGEMVGLAFDSYHDRRTGFEFDVTSAGSQLDVLLRNDGWDTSWNAVWESATGREAGAWTAEFRIPLSQLRYANSRGEQVWGLHSWRWIRRLQEESNWQLLPMDNPGLVYCFGELRGISDLPRSRNIEILPYALARHATSAAEPGNPFRTGSDSELEAGLDAKIGLSSNLTLNLTLNPDFGQVEADPSEINLTAYETFYSEKRPFFLEGKNILDWGVGDDLAFYSRRIGHAPSLHPATDGFSDVPSASRILGAAKLTGKTPDGLSLGALYAVTNKETADIVDADGTGRTQAVEPLTHYLVARAQQDIAKGNTIVGGLLTATRRDINDPALAFLPEAAYTAGFDFQQFWNERAYNLDLRLIGSRIEGSAEAIERLMRAPVHYYQRPDAEHLDVQDDARSLEGHGGKIRLGKNSGGKWRYAAAVDWRSPGLELNDLGYLYVADRVTESAVLEYVDTEPASFHRRYNIHLHQNSRFDFDGTHLQDDAHLSGDLVFRNNWGVSAFVGWCADYLDTRVLRGGPALRSPGWLNGEVSMHTDSGRDYHWSVDLERSVAADGDSSTSEIDTGFSFRAFDILNVDTNVSWGIEHNDVQYARTARAADNLPRYVLGRMDQRTLDTTLRLEVNFTPKLSLAWYGNVYLTAGRFSEFKEITSPRAGALADRFVPLGERIDYDAASGLYHVGADDGGYSFANPDFNWRALRSNFVLRWEYRPGSTLYAVWTQNRNDSGRAPEFAVGDEYRSLFGAHPDNTFLIKASYWFSL